MRSPPTGPKKAQQTLTYSLTFVNKAVLRVLVQPWIRLSPFGGPEVVVEIAQGW